MKASRLSLVLVVPRIPYVGIAFNQIHADQLAERMVEMVIDGMRDESSDFYQAAFADMVKGKGSKRSRAPDGDKPKKTKKSKTEEDDDEDGDDGSDDKKKGSDDKKKGSDDKKKSSDGKKKRAKPKKKSKAELMAMLEKLRNKKKDEDASGDADYDEYDDGDEEEADCNDE